MACKPAANKGALLFEIILAELGLATSQEVPSTGMPDNRDNEEHNPKPEDMGSVSMVRVWSCSEGAICKRLPKSDEKETKGVNMCATEDMEKARELIAQAAEPSPWCSWIPLVSKQKGKKPTPAPVHDPDIKLSGNHKDPFVDSG